MTCCFMNPAARSLSRATRTDQPSPATNTPATHPNHHFQPPRTDHRLSTKTMEPRNPLLRSSHHTSLGSHRATFQSNISRSKHLGSGFEKIEIYPQPLFPHRPTSSRLTPTHHLTSKMKRNIVIFLIILLLFIFITLIGYLIYRLQTRMAVGGGTTGSSVSSSDMTENVRVTV
ncbi:hypothetical protein M011DRAFT_530238 [Sporormia fimetaria CBS 119925]|uniref:Uncharacterized protein n=1 Tax=Sporormia fimetaria CBS 119925 TaxID=1340428 RepID=A0A6A6UXZ7_9PLEO|nr:hypothetical protein M011DRAFT_530238 [Sporormia fimetaria CBS 119925]